MGGKASNSIYTMPGKRFFDVLFYNSEGTKKADPQKSRFLKFKRESQLFKVVLFMEQAYQRCILLQYCTMYMYSKRFVFLTLANSFPKLFFSSSSEYDKFCRIIKRKGGSSLALCREVSAVGHGSMNV